MLRSTMVPVLLAALGLSACAPTPASGSMEPAPTTATPASNQCEASKASAAIGQQPSAEIVEQARVQAGAEIVRTLRHDQPITKEFRYGRLNLVLGADGRIASINCS